MQLSSPAQGLPVSLTRQVPPSQWAALPQSPWPKQPRLSTHFRVEGSQILPPPQVTALVQPPLSG